MIIFPDIDQFNFGAGIVGEFIDDVLLFTNKKITNKTIGCAELFFLFHVNKMNVEQKKNNCFLNFIEHCYCGDTIGFFLECVKRLPKTDKLTGKLVDFSSNLEYFFEHKIIPSKKLFENCKLSISKSNIYGLIGHNGLGKSTLLKTIATIKN
jgi:ABC-type multidrug transport system fused ATPase/permease subunit